MFTGLSVQVSQAPIIFPRGDRDSRGRGPMRKEIAIPAQGIVDIRNSLSEILEECGSDDGEYGEFVCCRPALSLLRTRS